jgi:hypothetical protein
MTAWTATRRTASGASPTVNLGASTLVRVVDNGEDDPEFVRRPVGFITEIDTRGPVYRQRYPLGVTRPGLRIRVWLRRATGDLWALGLVALVVSVLPRPCRRLVPDLA